VQRSKADQEGEGAAVYLTPRAARAVRRWLDAGGIAEGPVFRGLSRAGRPLAPLSGAAVALILKHRAARAGLDPASVSGHSCRVGMAQDLAADGSQGPAIMQAGRWRSPATWSRATPSASRRGAARSPNTIGAAAAPDRCEAGHAPISQPEGAAGGACARRRGHSPSCASAA
jgi:integrase